MSNLSGNQHLSPEQKRKLVRIRDWLLETAVHELSDPIMCEYDIGHKKKIFSMLNEVSKLAKSIQELSLEADDFIYVLPDFEGNYLKVKSSELD